MSSFSFSSALVARADPLFPPSFACSLEKVSRRQLQHQAWQHRRGYSPSSHRSGRQPWQVSDLPLHAALELG